MRKWIFISGLLMVIGCNNATSENKNIAANEKLNGEEIFSANCANCHKLQEDFVGPALKGVHSRWTDKALLYAFIRNPQEVIDKNEYAKGLHTKYSTLMTPFPYLSNEEIDAILKYCN